ncbi:hypothetical protein BGZ83_004681, partial [Gryganskiella cystojenkinii]
YTPAVIHSTAMLAALGNKRGLVDVLSFFGVIRNAYSHHSLEKAHTIVEEHLKRYGSKSNLVLYIDGGPALEKQETSKKRRESGSKAALKCTGSLDKLESIIENDGKPRKSHFVDVKKSLSSTFYWSSEDRQALIRHLQQTGWTVRVCETEADVAIAQDSKPDNIVISADSDMLGYASVTTLWRPVGKHLVLAYKISDICKVLGLTRQQLTALAVVSSNDYNRNIFSLGPATNYAIIKGIDGQ